MVKRMNEKEEKAIFDRATEKLDLLRGHHAFSTVGIRVNGFGDDDDSDWMRYS